MQSAQVAQPAADVIQVIVENRGENDCHVHLAGREMVWGQGRSEDEALGALVRQHSDIFRVALQPK